MDRQMIMIDLVNLSCGKEEILSKYTWIKTETNLKYYAYAKMQIIWWNA